MTQFFEVRTNGETFDIVEFTDAVNHIEACGEGSMVKFRVEKNIPNCLPEYVEKSCGSACFEYGQWRGSIAPTK